MAIVPNGVETLPKISIARVGCTNVTDRQTDDRRTGDDTAVTFTFAKNSNIHTSDIQSRGYTSLALIRHVVQVFAGCSK